MILVTGVTGKVGGEVARQLATAGRPARAMVRSPLKATQVPQGVEVVVGGLDDDAALARACGGVEAVFMGSFDEPRMLALQARLIAAAKRAGVKRIARLSALSANADSPHHFSRVHGEGDRQVLQSGIGGIAIQPTWFNQNFLTYFPKGRLRMAVGDGRIGFIDVRDIAAVAIAALAGPGYEGQSLELTGPQALSHAQVADMLTRETGKLFTFEDVDPATFEAEQLKAGVEPSYIALLLGLFGRIRAGESARITKEVERVLGRPAIHFALFARDHKDELVKQL